MSLQNEKVADLFDAMGSLFARLSHEFRQAGAPGEEQAPTPVPAPRTRKAKAAVEPVPAPEAEPADELTVDDVRTALKSLMEKHGKEVMASTLKAVGAGRLADVDESQYGELMGLIATASAFEIPEEAPAPVYPEFSEVTAVFKQLIQKDKARATLVLSAFDVAKVSALPQDKWQEAIDTVIAVLAEPEAEDDLL